MIEETKKEEEPTPDNTGEGVQQKAITELDRADQIAERQKRENDRREDLLKREESLEASRRVGGRADAGQPPQDTKEETPQEYKDRIMRGE